MVAKKSAAQLRRMQARAAARGETYTPPEQPASTEASASATEEQQQTSSQTPQESEETIQTKVAAAEKLEAALATLEANPDNLNSKDRRSAKRKAEAIATEECDGIPAQELLEWYQAHKKKNGRNKKKTKGGKKGGEEVAQLSPADQVKADAAKKLREELSQLEANKDINAKERRSAKRKAEAIAAEESGCQAEELLQWYETVAPPAKDADEEEEGGKKIPYIVFVGQLSFSTTVDMLYEHFETNLGKEVITKETTKIRLLTDAKTKKSRGMAFVELSTPEAMYECLKLHLTHLDGRRLNVERTTGGGKAAKKSKISSFRESQSAYISQTVDQILSDHMKNGDIMEGELDDGVIALCKRHSAQVVEHALKEYAEEKKVRRERKEELGEKEEEEMRNPSAFLTHMLGRIAEEGFESSNLSGSKRGGGGEGGRSGGRGRGGGPGRGSGSGGAGRGGDRRGASSRSVLEEGGVDMSASKSSGGRIQQIFPSMQRGRGRGRGYM